MHAQITNKSNYSKLIESMGKILEQGEAKFLTVSGKFSWGNAKISQPLQNNQK